MNRLTKTRSLLRRLLNSIFAYNDYLLYRMPAKIPAGPIVDEEEAVLLDSGTFAGRTREVQAILSLNAANNDYLEEVRVGNALAVVVFFGGKPVHYAFVFFRNRTRCLLGLPPSSGLLAHAFTSPGYRGRGCQPRSVAIRAGAAARAGCAWVFAETSPDNHASQSGLRKAGMECVGRLVVIRVLRYFVYRPVRPDSIASFSFCW